MKTLLDQYLPARTGWAGIVERGQRLRIVEVDGGQIVERGDGFFFFDFMHGHLPGDGFR